MARSALQLAARPRSSPFSDPRVYLRRAHVGYYLIDKGFEELKSRIGYHPRVIDRIRTTLLATLTTSSSAASRFSPSC